MVELLFKHGADVNATSNSHVTPLVASMNEHYDPDLTEFFIKKGAEDLDYSLFQLGYRCSLYSQKKAWLVKTKAELLVNAGANIHAKFVGSTLEQTTWRAKEYQKPGCVVLAEYLQEVNRQQTQSRVIE